MIGRLEGRLEEIHPGTVLIDANGVGYLVSITVRAFQVLAGSERATLWIHTQVRDDAIVLFGFPEREDLAAFEELIQVAGVGPRTALAVLSALDARELAGAVEAGDLVRLQSIPGIGRKTAERLLLELKDRFVAVTTPGVPDLRGDAVSALVNLGYPRRVAEKAVDSAQSENAEHEIGDILRRALQHLTR